MQRGVTDEGGVSLQHPTTVVFHLQIKELFSILCRWTDALGLALHRMGKFTVQFMFVIDTRDLLILSCPFTFTNNFPKNTEKSFLFSIKQFRYNRANVTFQFHLFANTRKIIIFQKKKLLIFHPPKKFLTRYRSQNHRITDKSKNYTKT